MITLTLMIFSILGEILVDGVSIKDNPLVVYCGHLI